MNNNKKILAGALAFAFAGTAIAVTGTISHADDPAPANNTPVVDVAGLHDVKSQGNISVRDGDYNVEFLSSDLIGLEGDIKKIAEGLNTENTDRTKDTEELKGNIADSEAELKGDIAKTESKILKILGMDSSSGEVDENGDVIERNEDGTINRIIHTETTIDGTDIVVTRYDTSKNPREKIDEVHFDTSTGKAKTKEGTTVDPIIEQNVPTAGQTTVTIVNGDGTKTTIVYTNDTTLEDIKKYIKDNYNFTDAQLTNVDQLIKDAMDSGATTKQDIINYIENHTVSQEQLNLLLNATNATSTDGEVGVTMDEVKAYLESLVPAPSSQEVTKVIEQYLTMSGLTQSEINSIIEGMNNGDANSDGFVTKTELQTYLVEHTSYSTEEITKLITAYTDVPTTTEINNYYKAFETTEVNNITNAVTEKYDDTALRMQIKDVSDAQLSILDKLTILSNYVDHGGNDATYDGIRAKYTPATDTTAATVTFSPIKTN